MSETPPVLVKAPPQDRKFPCKQCGAKLSHAWNTKALTDGKHVVEVVATNVKGKQSKRRFEVYAGNKRVFRRLIDGGAEKSAERKWQDIHVELADFTGKELQLRLYQRVLLPDHIPGNAYWKNLKIK